MISGAGAIGVKGFLGLKEENETIEKKIETLNKTIKNNYSNALLTLDSSKDTLIDSKTEYENQAELSNLNSGNYTSEKYDIDYLWTKLGNFAKDENIDIKIDVNSAGVKDLYNLTFTATGTYSGITAFIYDIENDSKLGFKIDKFSMSGSTDVIGATFNCNEIYIDLNKIDKGSNSSGNTTNTTGNTTTSSGSSSKNTTSNTNTTNTTNSTNTSTSTNTSGSNTTNTQNKTQNTQKTDDATSI